MSKNSEKVAAIKKTITESFIKALEEGLTHPEGWKAPWHTTGLRGAVNATTGKRYHGGNVFWLSMSEHGGPWATYKQWSSIGAQVRKGEKSTPILTPMPFKKEDKDTGKVKSGVFFGTANVFSADQVFVKADCPNPNCDADEVDSHLDSTCEDCKGFGYIDGGPWQVAEVPATEGELPAEAEAFLAAVAAEIATVTSDEPRAYYSPGSDRVHLPVAFKTAEGRFSTSAHEYGHATGAHSRLNRDGVTGHHPFGSSGYAKEELIAEFTSAFLGATFGVETEMAVEGGIGQDHADYLANWLAVLKSDTTAVWQAATAASKASEFLLDLAASKAEKAAA
jgi:antirestriction protein ArdC